MSDIIMRTDSSKQGLADLIAYLGDWTEDKIMVEVGCFKGDSTVLFAKFGKFKEVYAVDPYKNNIGDITDKCDMREVRRYFKKAIKKYEHVIHIEELSAHASVMFEDNSIDFVYIDALHTEKAMGLDIDLWLPKIKKGGFIGGHDYRKRFAGVIKAVKERLGEPDKVFKDTSWILKL
jgi:hypothetical protein